MKKKDFNLEKEIEKLICISFPTHNNDNWDITIYDSDSDISNYFSSLSTLIIKEKDKMIYEITYWSYFQKKVFFDLNFDFNDTPNNLKKASIELIDILNNNR